MVDVNGKKGGGGRSGGSNTVVDVTPSKHDDENGKTRLNSSIRTNSTKSTEYSSSLSSYANLTESLFSEESTSALEDTVSELAGLLTDHSTNTYENKSPYNPKESYYDEVDHVGVSLGAASSNCSNASDISFLEKIRSLAINEVNFNDVQARKSKKVMGAYIDAFINSQEDRSARRRSTELLSEHSTNNCKLDDNPVIAAKKKESSNKRDDRLSNSMNDIKSKSPAALSKEYSDLRKKERITNQVNAAAYKSGKPRRRKTSSSQLSQSMDDLAQSLLDEAAYKRDEPCRRKKSSGQLSHSMNDLAQSQSIIDYKPARKNNKQRKKHSVLISSMNDMNNRSTLESQYTQSPRNRRVSFSEAEAEGIQHSSSKQSKISVKNLPWVDHKGKEGEYTGEVNGLMQPHGSGILKYNDSTSLNVAWVNGTPKSSSLYSPSAFEAKIILETKSRKRPSNLDQSSLSSKNYLPGFILGDTACPEDMIIEDDEDQALANIKTLKVHDFAFVKRSDEVTWTYAVFANFFAKKGKINGMRFVIDDLGSTKTIEKHDWAECVRMVNNSESCTSHSCSAQEDMNYVVPDSPCSSEEAVKEELRLDDVKDFFETSEKRRPRYIHLS